jgi:hypothetical protein
MKRVLIITASVLFAFFFINKILDKGYKKFWNPVFEKLDTVFEDTTSRDVIFLGDSRANYGINPFYIDSITGLNSYNVGMGGAAINEIGFLTSAWYQYHTAPKLVVISIGYVGIFESNTFFDNPCYYFYYNNKKFIKHVLDSLHYHTNLFKYLPITKYTAFDEFNKTTILRSYTSGDSFLKRTGVAYKGFINNERTSVFNNSPIFNFNDNIKTADTNAVVGLNKLKTLIEMAQQKSKVLLVYPPVFYDSNKKENPIFNTIKAAINQLGINAKVEILNFETDTSFSKKYFQDTWHLNIEGTTFYSKNLAYKINEMLTNK